MMKKGITPVVAIVLLLMMTVAAAAGSYLWLTTITGRLQENIGETATQFTKTQGQIDIIALCWANDSTAYNLQIIATNVGSVDLSGGTFTAIIVDPESDNAIGYVTNTTAVASGSKLTTNSVTEFRFDVADTILSDTNTNYIITFKSPDGVEASDTC